MQNNGEKTEVNYFNLKEGQKTPREHEIKEIYSVGSNFICFTLETPPNSNRLKLWVEYSGDIRMTEQQMNAYDDFRDLRNLSLTILHKFQRQKAYEFLSDGIERCFTSLENTDLSVCFIRARNFIETRCLGNLRMIYFGFVTFFLIFLLGILVFSISIMPDEPIFYRHLVRGCLFGVLGATLSILIIESKKDKVPDLFVSPFELAMDAGIRLLVGAISGLFLVSAVYSGIAFNFAKDNINQLSFFSGLAGFVEKLIPQLFWLEANKATESEKKGEVKAARAESKPE